MRRVVLWSKFFEFLLFADKKIFVQVLKWKIEKWITPGENDLQRQPYVILEMLKTLCHFPWCIVGI